MKTSVYIGDLRHKYGGVLATDTMPLSVGYMKAVMDRDLAGEDVDVRIFAYPDHLLAAMEESPPDVLMLGNYIWNEALGLFFFRRAKRLNPAALTVMGGPNIPIDAHRRIEYVSSRPEIDVYVLGEGDFLAADIVTWFLEDGRSVAKLCERPIPSSIRRRADGEIVAEAAAGRNQGVNDIPSPYLTGIMDQFFDGKLAPFIETNRGCPFRCTFCVQGTDYYSRITNFDMSRLEEEIDYIGRMVTDRSPSMGTLRIADSNYGMYPRDVEISSYIGKSQKAYGYPTFIDATTGKNQAERIIESMEKVNGALVLYQAVQSLDEDVLKNIKRSNIKLGEYEKMQVHVRGRGLRSSTDLILGLPGESLTSHLAALHKLIDAGTSQINCFQAILINGAELDTQETRERYQLEPRFRVGPKNYGEYAGERVFDIEEFIVGTNTLPFEDYIRARKHHLCFNIFWNDDLFLDVVRMVEEHFGIKPSEWLTATLDAMERDTGVAGQLLHDFVHETEGELFSTREACAEFYSRDENFERLREGEIGDNLMYKYRATASFFAWKEICACTMGATRELLLDHGAAERFDDFQTLWSDFHAYIDAKHAHGTSAAEITQPVEMMLRHDIQAWLEAGAPIDVRPYRLEEPRRFIFELSDEGRGELQNALDVWSTKITGLIKLVRRIRVSSQVRLCRPADVGEPAIQAT